MSTGPMPAAPVPAPTRGVRDVLAAWVSTWGAALGAAFIKNAFTWVAMSVGAVAVYRWVRALVVPFSLMATDPLRGLAELGTVALAIGIKVWVVAKLAAGVVELLSKAQDELKTAAADEAKATGTKAEKVPAPGLMAPMATLAEGATKGYSALFAMKAATWSFLLCYNQTVSGQRLESGWGIAVLLTLFVSVTIGVIGGLLTWEVAEPRERELTKIASFVIFCIVMGFSGYWAIGKTQDVVEARWPASSGDRWAVYLTPRDTRALGETPTQPGAGRVLELGDVEGWTLTPCSTRQLVTKDGRPVFVVDNANPTNAALAELARLQAVTDRGSANPANTGWVDQITGRTLPWRFFIRVDGTGRGTVVQVTDPTRAFGPDGELVTDLSLVSERDRATVKRAWTAQLGGRR